MIGACLIVLGLASAGLGCETGQSCLPDTDQSGLNNSFDAAEDIGVLGNNQTGEPRIFTRNGELGAVQNGFDTIDFYKFRLPPNIFEVTISTTEDPPTSSWIMVYDQNRRPLITEEQGRGRDNESVTLNLPAGTYYVSVATNAGVANGRHLKYSLKIAPTIRALPDQAAADCSPNSSFEQLATGRTVSGSLSGVLRAAYPVYLTNGSQFSTTPIVFPRVYDVFLRDRATGDRIQVVQAQRSDVRYIAVDPGFYCLEVTAGFRPTPINYQFTVGAANMGFPPGRDRGNAPCVTMVNVGNLSRNGQYDRVRQPQISNPNTSCSFQGVTQYVMREWVGAQRPDAWFRFDLQDTRKLELAMSNLYNPARAEIQDRQGNVLAGSVAQGIPLTDQLPHQVLTRVLPAGTYYLRVSYVGTRSTGTNVQVWMVANPP